MSYGHNNPFGAHAQPQQLYPPLPEPQHHTHTFPHIHNPFQHAPGHPAPGQPSGALVPAAQGQGQVQGRAPPGALLPAGGPFGTGNVAVNQYGAPYVPDTSAAGWGSSYGPSYPSYTASRVQAPQAIEEPAKDEDATYGPLGRARSKIERAMVSDNEISLDLVEKLQQREFMRWGWGQVADHSYHRVLRAFSLDVGGVQQRQADQEHSPSRRSAPGADL